MAELESFTSIEVQPVVYCRAARIWSKTVERWLTWRQIGHEDLFDWPIPFPVQRYARAWDSKLHRRNGLTFAKFRERVGQIAAETLSHITGVIVTYDFETLCRTVERLGRCIVVPVDDDDWLSPHLAQRLGNLTLRDRTLLVAWPNVLWWCDYDDEHRFREWYCAQNLHGVPSAVGSNSYGLTDRAFREWPASVLKESLNCHWKIQIPSETETLKELLSLEVKHIGSTNVLLSKAEKTYWWTERVPGFKPPLWVKEHCDKVRELHAQLVTDMGGTFDKTRIIQETANQGSQT